MSGAGAELDPVARAALETVLEQLAVERASVSSVTTPEQAWKVHVEDSLTGLAVEDLRAAGRIADVGAGAGFPGLALAAALPASRVDLVESVGRKCDFIRRAAGSAGIANAEVICARSEELAKGSGREAYDAVTARAVGRLSTLAELASPLLRDGGVLVAWKGRRDPGEELELERAAAELAMRPESVLEVGCFAGSRHRHLHVVRKEGETPPGLPRRPGMAKKRPRGG
ncbi:MAG: 16S rRNA (guanine(527)-N(7))-methyltransferase RsmG [Solirubrobacterales bacterium]